MKTTIILLLTLGHVFADPISKQTFSAGNSLPTPGSLNCSDSETKHNEETKSNKGESEQKSDVNENFISSVEVTEEQVPYAEVLVEEAVGLQSELASETDGEISLDESEVSLIDDVYPNELLEKHPEEIMDTAAGFVPLPIKRRRQKPRRRPASRRHYLRNPYRRFYIAYPYYYYGYYRPSSLRYYY